MKSAPGPPLLSIKYKEFIRDRHVMPAVPTRRVRRQGPFAGMLPRPQAAAACSQRSLLTVVDPLVLDELGTLAKGLAECHRAGFSPVWVRRCRKKYERPRKALPQSGALVGLLTRVDALVLDEHRAPDEGLAALAAERLALARVQPLVPHQVGALAEGLAAFAALRMASPHCGCAGAA